MQTEYISILRDLAGIRPLSSPKPAHYQLPLPGTRGDEEEHPRIHIREDPYHTILRTHPLAETQELLHRPLGDSEVRFGLGQAELPIQFMSSALHDLDSSLERDRVRDRLRIVTTRKAVRRRCKDMKTLTSYLHEETIP